MQKKRHKKIINLKKKSKYACVTALNFIKNVVFFDSTIISTYYPFFVYWQNFLKYYFFYRKKHILKKTDK